ncbi:ATP synthase subunit s, mitochondrial, partial [Eurytemora carolleeae]|uniref:ATP synthase subunit s, mitochondrial n=1 Tax=Eurytemora carolleeae TaxID=1294199 RepID=UPI000C78DB6F
MSGVRNISRILKPTNRIFLRQNRSIFGLFQGWFDSVFNKVDEARIKEVGVDRAAAEWVLRCGGGVKWEGGGRMLTDYNALPAGNY